MDPNYEQNEILREIKQKDKGGHYSILGLQRNCSADDVKKAYLKLSLKVHPDKNKSPEAGEAFKIVSEAYQSLIEKKNFLVSRKNTHTCWDMQTSFSWDDNRKKNPDPAPSVPVKKPPPRPPVLNQKPRALRRCEYFEICGGHIYGKGDVCEYCKGDENEGGYYDPYE